MASKRVINLHRSYGVNCRRVKRIISRVLKYCGRCDKAEVEIVFLTDKAIKALNKKYKGEDHPTDVLSFDLGGSNFGAGPLLGEIFISIDRALKNSRIFNTAFEKEFTLYIIHGILHLAGYDDGTKKERSRMDRKQKAILKDLCKKEDLSKVLTPL